MSAHEKHINAQIGDAIYDCKKRLFQRLKANLDLRSATALCLEELRHEFAEIVAQNEDIQEATDGQNLIQ